jgi:glycosyltransferase involved in cell wall biosynthesis
VVLEAMHARLSVASTKVGGLYDSIGEHEERGIYIDEFAVEKFSRYLQKISTNDQEIIEQKEKAYQFVEEKIKQFTTISKLLHNEHTTFNS